MKLTRTLVEDVDYIVLEPHPAFTTDGGATFYRSNSAIEVYSPEFEEHGKYLCPKCKAFMSFTVKGIHAHQRVHKPKPKAPAPTVMNDSALRVVAFNLLPPKMQVRLLAQARALIGGAP